MEPVKRLARFGLATAVIFAGSVSSLLPTRSAMAAAGEIDGTVFNDWNQDGVRQTPEPGIGGVTVTVVSESGVALSTATATNGSYTVGGLSGRYRIEFSGQPAGMHPSRAGTGSATTVQFAESGATVNAAFSRPSDYCQANPEIVVSCFQQTPAFAASLRSVPYNGGTLTQKASATDTGATYGAAFHRQSKTVFQAAFMKRGVPVGPEGLGAIYKTPAAGGASTLFASISGAGINPRPASPDYNRDSEAFAAVYKVGLGDIDMSADDKTLYAVNLANNGIYSIAVNPDGTAGAVSGPMTVPSPSDCTGEFHVFGLGIFGTRGMVGGVCATGSLRGYVFEFTAQGPAASIIGTPAFTFPMDYSKGEVLSGGLVTVPDTGSNPWLPWNITDENEARVTKFFNGTQETRSAPQGQITDLQLNDRGDLVIGLRDRFGDQGGSDILGSVPTDNGIYDFMSGGDLLLACVSGTTWTLESGGSCGGRAGAGANGQGPGGGEFFNDDFVSPLFPTGPHPETSLGSLLRVPGKSEIVATVYDPNKFYSNGFTHFADANGATGSKAEIQVGRSNFGKANGLGDIEALCDQAPIEIGNRIWLDANGDGVQDPADLGIAGVQVELFKGASKVSTGTVQTATDGTYYFNESNVPGGIVPGATDYSIQIPNATGSSQQSVLTGYSLTATDTVGTGNDVRDSDATASGNVATIAVPATSIAAAGMNNHTFDAGFTAPPAVTYSLGNRVWFDTNNNGSMESGEVGAAAVNVRLLSSTGDPLPGRLVATDANGHYRFDNLAAGDYIVCIDPSNFAGTGPLVGYASSTLTEANPNADIDSNDNGRQPTNPSVAVTTCINSGLVTLGGSTAEPSGETDQAATPGDSLDSRSNLTVDFGFYKTAVGNTVWLDANNDGAIQSTEPRLSGVVVELRDSACGSVLGTSTTNRSGEYLIDRTADGGVLPVGLPLTVAIGGGQTPLAGLDPSSPVGTADSFNHGSLNSSGAICSAPFTIDPGTITGGQLVENPRAFTSNPTLDFGFNGPLASVGDRVWNDLNKNGQQDSDEPGVPNVDVELLKSDGTLAKTVKTDSNGLYRFIDLQPGTCSIRFVRSSLPTGATFTVVDTGADVSDSDADPTTGLIKICSIGKREYVSTIDAGIVTAEQPGPVAAVPVVSAAVSPVVPTTVPPAPFTPTPSSTVVTPTTTPPDTKPATPSSPELPGRLASTVWLDINENGVLDGVESPIASVQLRITGPNGFLRIVETDSLGRYDLNGLAPGEYSVEITGVGLLPEQKLLSGRTVSVQVLGTEVSAPTAVFRVTIPGELALTGTNLKMPLWIGTSVIAVGLVITGAARRRKRPAPGTN
jgi:hypothetical protein